MYRAEVEPHFVQLGCFGIINLYCISECAGLDPTWDKVKTEKTFPIVFGTLVKVVCDPGYELKGSNTIVCDRNTTFTFVEQPACKELGRCFRHCVCIVLLNPISTRNMGTVIQYYLSGS